MLSLGLLVSGNLGRIALDYLNNRKDINLCFAFTDKKSVEIIDFCDKNHIPRFAGNPRLKDKEVKGFLGEKDIDYIFSINYLFIVGETLLNHPKKHSINIHGSLLPKYRGRTPHVWAIINGENETGVTAHLMDEDCDSGSIVKQLKIPIDYNDTGASILQKFNAIYLEILNDVINDITSDHLKFIKQENEFATYFGKRTPDDGEINWNWQKERIRNWVRAQADPYPGAFTFMNDKKIIIDEISYCDYGFSEEESNGTVVKVVNKKPYIKTPNGVVILEKLREEKIIFQNNMLLGQIWIIYGK